MNLRNQLGKSASVLAAALTLAVSADAQAFNIDFNHFSEVVPPNSFGGFAGQFGKWNDFNLAPNPLALDDIFSQPTSVTITLNNAFPTIWTQPFGVTVPSPFDTLYNDFAPGTPDNWAQIDGLEVGTYLVVVYSWTPDGTATAYASSPSPLMGAPKYIENPSTLPPQVYLPAASTPGTPSTLAVFEVDIVNAGDPLHVYLDDDAPNGEFGDHALNGIQIVPILGETGGCPQTLPNSLGTVPQLTLFGPPKNGGLDAAAGWAVLNVGLVPTALPVGANFIQAWVSNKGNANVTFCPINGTRCVGNSTGGEIVRIPDSTGVTYGQVTSFGTYQIRVNLAALSALYPTLSTNPGDKLYFQMTYLDTPVPTDACAPFVGGLFNGQAARWTDMIEVELF